MKQQKPATREEALKLVQEHHARVERALAWTMRDSNLVQSGRRSSDRKALMYTRQNYGTACYIVELADGSREAFDRDELDARP